MQAISRYILKSTFHGILFIILKIFCAYKATHWKRWEREALILNFNSHQYIIDVYLKTKPFYVYMCFIFCLFEFFFLSCIFMTCIIDLKFIENIHSINLENRSLWRTIPSIIFVQKGSMRMLWLQLMLFVSCSNVKWFGRNSIFALYISLKMKAKLTHILGSKHCSPPSTLHVSVRVTCMR